MCKGTEAVAPHGLPHALAVPGDSSMQGGAGGIAAAPIEAAASSQRRLHQEEAFLDSSFTGLLLDPGRLGAALLKASATNARAQVAAKAAEPARRLLLARKRVGASAVDKYSEVVWRDVVRPASFDARALGIFSPPKDQGLCAACVAFAVTGAAEASIALVQPEIGRLIQQQGGLSPQQLYFCQHDQSRSCRQVSRACTTLKLA
jgi:hypothetical protein